MKKFIEVTERGLGIRTLIKCDNITDVSEDKETGKANLWTLDDDGSDYVAAEETYEDIKALLSQNGLLCTGPKKEKNSEFI